MSLLSMPVTRSWLWLVCGGVVWWCLGCCSLIGHLGLFYLQLIIDRPCLNSSELCTYNTILEDIVRHSASQPLTLLAPVLSLTRWLFP